MIKKKYSFFEKGVRQNREILEEYFQYDRRFYLVKDLNNPDAEPRPAIADRVDERFFVKKGEVRKGKYTDQPFQKKRAKAGGF